MMKKKIFVIILVIGLLGVFGNYYVDHFQGGEIYEATNSYNLVEEGFEVNLNVTNSDGDFIKGKLYSKEESTLYIIDKGERISVGGSAATEEDIRAKKIEVEVRGKVYVYKIPRKNGELGEIINDMSSDSYSQRFSGTIYIDEKVNIGNLGNLKYEIDELYFGHVGFEGISDNGVVLSVDMVPLEVLKENLGEKKVFLYGELIVNSKERALDYEVQEVRTH